MTSTDLHCLLVTLELARECREGNGLTLVAGKKRRASEGRSFFGNMTNVLCECCEKGAAAVLGACCPDSSRQVVVSEEYVGVSSFARNLLFYCFTAFRCASRLGFFVFPFHYTMFSI